MAAVTVEETGSEQDAEADDLDPCVEATLEARDLLLERCDACHGPLAERKPIPGRGDAAIMSRFEWIRSPSKMIEERYILPDDADDSYLYVVLKLGLKHGNDEQSLLVEVNRGELNMVRSWIMCGAQDWPADTL